MNGLVRTPFDPGVRHGTEEQFVRYQRMLAEMGLPAGWRHPVTGRRGFEPEPGLILLGAYVRRARHIEGASQRRAASKAGITQSMWSRLERGLAPSMDAERLVWLADGLYPNFPLGFCPHVDQHVCRWQPLSLEQEVRRPLTDREVQATLIHLGLGGDNQSEPI